MKSNPHFRGLGPLVPLTALALMAATPQVRQHAVRPPAVIVEAQQYGQIGDDGIDKAAYGKVLHLSLSVQDDGQHATLTVAGATPGTTMFLAVGREEANQQLPWGDTVLLADVIGVAPVTADADGSARLDVRLRSVSEISGDTLRLHAQAFASGEADFPLLTSNGLRIQITQS